MKRAINFLNPFPGFRRIRKEEPLLFLLPAGFLILVAADPTFIPIPLIVYWSVGMLWNDEVKTK